MKQTQEVFSTFANESITEQTAEEIEQNLKDFFTVLLSWEGFEQGEETENE